MLSVGSLVMQTGSCGDDSTGSVGGDSETNTTIASSPSLDPPTTKVSPMFSDTSELVTPSQRNAYDNLTTNFPKSPSKTEVNLAVTNLVKTASPASGICESSTPKCGRTTFEPPVSNLFRNLPTFEPPNLSCSFQNPIKSDIQGAYASQLVTSSVSSTFPSPGSAFTELHPKSGSCTRSQCFTQPVASESNRSMIHAIPSNSTSVEYNPSSLTAQTVDCSSRKEINPYKFCRICGQFHDPTSAHLYNYTQAVDADLCCTLCRQPLVDPLDTKCGHTFCSPCLKNHLAVQALCPVDKQIINYLECQQASNIVKRLLDKLLVACPNSRFCTGVVYRSNLEEHLRELCPASRISNENITKTIVTENSSQLNQSMNWKNIYHTNSSLTNSVKSNNISLIKSSPNSVDHKTIITSSVNRFDNHHFNLNSQSTNFSLNFPHQYLKEFPHLFPSLCELEQNRSKTKFNNHLPALTDNANSPAVVEGIPTSIVICRAPNCMDLGFTFIGGVDTPLACILIQEIYLDGPAALDGRLRPGDQLLEVNGNLLAHVTHTEARRLLSTSSSMVQLTVFREPITPNLQQSTPTHFQQEIFYVKLCKRPGKVLGIKLVGKKHLPGLYILELVPGSEADLDGRVKKDDQILKINGIDLTNGTQEQAAQIINSVSEYVVFKLSRRNRADTPDILRTTTDSEEKLETGLLALESLQLNDLTQSKENSLDDDGGQFNWSSLENDTRLSDTHSTTELIEPVNSDLKSSCSPTSIVNKNHTNLNNDQNNHSSSTSSIPSTHSPSVSSGGPVISKQLTSVNESVCHERTVIVNKAPEEPLGISIAGGRHSQRGDTPIYVTNISTECVLGRSKQVQRGDILLEVNGVGLVGLTHQEAVEVLRQISSIQSCVQLRLITAPETSDSPDNFMPSWTFWLRLPPICQLARIIRLRRDTICTPGYNGSPFSQPLGFSIVGGWGHDQSPSNHSSSVSDASPIQNKSITKSQVKQSQSPSQQQSGLGYANLYPCPIVIKSIVPGLLAHKDGRLKCGDLILAVNNVSMLNISHSAAVRLLKNARGDVLLQVISWPGTIV